MHYSGMYTVKIVSKFTPTTINKKNATRKTIGLQQLNDSFTTIKR